MGPITFHNLLAKYGNAENAAMQIESSFKNIKLASTGVVKRELGLVSQVGGKIILSSDEDYPELLRGVRGKPPVITALGNVDLLGSKKIIAIVGGRKASYNSCAFVKKLAYELAQQGFIIVSGLAAGIDTAAHHVIYSDLPTIAVMGNGIDVVYPSENRGLYKRIIENQGLLITECPYGSYPKPWYFPQRNRIISGLSVGVIVVEAGIKSGSLITARFALSQGKEVFAVPGAPSDVRCTGSNILLKEGATLVQSVSDVIEALEFMGERKLCQANLFDSSRNELGVVQNMILAKLSSEPYNIDELISVFGLRKFQEALSELELDQKIERYSGDAFSLKVS